VQEEAIGLTASEMLAIPNLMQNLRRGKCRVVAMPFGPPGVGITAAGLKSVGCR
jgi:hypothetical protein